MTRKRTIGRFRRSKQGGWEGEINTLSIQRAIRLVTDATGREMLEALGLDEDLPTSIRRK